MWLAMSEMGKTYKTVVGNLERKRQYEDLDLGGRIISKWIMLYYSILTHVTY
jgi:hypothetical protein